MLNNILFGLLAGAFLVIGILAFLLEVRNKKALQEEEKRIEDECKKREEELNVLARINSEYVKEKTKSEELEKEMASDDINGFNAGLELLHNIEESGRKRNSN